MKMEKSLTIFALGIALFLSAMVFADPPPVQRWVARYDGPAHGNDSATHVVVDNLGNVYVTGYSYGGSSTGNDYVTIKYDPLGNKVWDARYDGPGHGNDEAAGLAVDFDGNVYVTGYSYGGSGTGFDYATIKYDRYGHEVWKQRYNNELANGDDCTTALVLKSNNVYVTGYSWRGCDIGYDYATIKYDTNGTQLWEARYNGPANGDDCACALAVDNSGNVYVTGESYGGSSTYTDYATIKYDTNGNQLWVERYDNGNFDAARALAVGNSGNVYVTGYSTGSSTGKDYATIKYDTNGTQLWVARYDNGYGGDWDWAYALAVDNFGNVYVTGISSDSGTSYDYATIKYGPLGNKVWEARYNGPANLMDWATDVALDNSGNVYVTGLSSGGSGTAWDYATIKYGYTTFYVDNDAPDDPSPNNPDISDPNENGSTMHPFDSIQEAIDAAIDGDTIMVLDGTYTGTGNRNIDPDGKAVRICSKNGPAGCIIDCQGSPNGTIRKGGFNIHSGEDSNCIVEGFTILHGSGFFVSVPSCGGVICCMDSSPIISNCIIRENYLTGIDMRHSNSVIRNCIIADNFNGGVIARYGTQTIDNCQIINNQSWMGAGCFFKTNDATICNSTISSNLALNASSGGGGLYVEDANILLTSHFIT